MKRMAWLLAVVLFLSGCGGKNTPMERGIALRERILGGDQCSFEMEITADFGDSTYTFCLQCEGDAQGNVKFSVLTPDSISGISGVIDSTGGKLTFDDTALAFSLLADGEVSPVSAPWLFLKAMRSGYMRAASTEEEYTRITVDDSFESDALQLDVWLDPTDVPVQAEVIWQGRRVLSMCLRNFVIV